MFEPELLRTFLAVERAGGFTAAGRILGLRQSTVSGHVARLEKAAGRELFRRDTRNLALTADGAAMVGFARSILEAQHAAEQYFSQSTLTGLVRLGASDDLVATQLPDILLDFRRSHPGVDLQLTVGLSDNLKSRMAAGELDLVFGKRLPGKEEGEFLFRDRLVWAGRPEATPPTDPVPLVVYPEPSLTRRVGLETLERAGRASRVACVSDSQLGLRAAVLAGLGIAVHVETLLPTGLFPIDDPNLPELGDLEFVLIHRHAVSSGPEQALSEAILANTRRLRQP
ncbi:LysR family transcriptional regulator [Nocardia sp. NPDC052566]|uniref:LysR family transcriptional regulator n=1 Tax=Nocardia sp. NPDC052566 TaxID=3364330 RepID=UPI0037CA4526